MKQCISEEQFNQLSYDKLIEFAKYFNVGEGLTAKWWTLGKIIEVLQGEGIKILLDNCIPASVWVERDKKEYCGIELCDVLWKVILNYI
jgi:hypothetical protein